ncbi:nucleoside hydrolase [Sulfobacillus harzensis]|uniref:Nucleoside hydrolase n=1 Tax=Sulfobacillus harzensis TaxID=2729629 RepID=A0A7Y0L0F2_9FIRM|nr:nucleoside hydrolase [Sulfobacillus harzensis]NMP20982.1 nucleoside hydrolase [Sulfobacillus harzensis]
MDPGIDDALALYVALGSLRVAGLAAVAGNVEQEKTFRNSQILLQAAGRPDIPVWPGSRAPFSRALHTAPHVHGTSGLDGWELPPLERPFGLEDPPWLAWPPLLRAERAPRIIATGPLTNLAKLLWCLPTAQPPLAGITLMGGGLERGNVTPTAEFNFYVDPEAADAVMQAPVPVKMVGLDVTHKARMPWPRVEALVQMGPLGQILYDLLSWYGSHVERHPAGLAVHDAVAVAAHVHPEFFQWERHKLAVLCEGDLRGTVVRMPSSAGRPLVEVATDVDSVKVMDFIWESLSRLQ